MTEPREPNRLRAALRGIDDIAYRFWLNHQNRGEVSVFARDVSERARAALAAIPEAPEPLEGLRALSDALDDIPAEIWVVDNASTDGSAAAIRAQFPAVRLIENARNLGFGAANNQALCQAQGEFFLLLNSDAFLKPGALAGLVAYLRRHPRVAAVGPRLVGADGALQVSCYRFPSPSRAWYENLWISAALPSRRKAILR